MSSSSAPTSNSNANSTPVSTSTKDVNDSYTRLGWIGGGTYGEVYKCVRKSSEKYEELVASNRPKKRGIDDRQANKVKPKITSSVGAIPSDAFVAVKRVINTANEDGISRSTIREVALLRELSHPSLQQENIVKVEEIYVYPALNAVDFVLEYAEHDLAQIIEYHRCFQGAQRRVPKSLIKSAIWQLLNGLHFLHSNWIIHRDLKPSNLLVKGPGPDEGVLKIADFGLARIFQSPLVPLGSEGLVVTAWYRAPELLLKAQHYTPAIDIWAVGCIFAELLRVEPLFHAASDDDKPDKLNWPQIKKVMSVLGVPREQEWPDFPHLPFYRDLKHRLEAEPMKFEKRLRRDLEQVRPDFAEEGKDLLAKMLVYDPKKRITAAEALNHPYFKNASDKPFRNSIANPTAGSYHYWMREIWDKKKPPKPAKVAAPAHMRHARHSSASSSSSSSHHHHPHPHHPHHPPHPSHHHTLPSTATSLSSSDSMAAFAQATVHHAHHAANGAARHRNGSGFVAPHQHQHQHHTVDAATSNASSLLQTSNPVVAFGAGGSGNGVGRRRPHPDGGHTNNSNPYNPSHKRQRH